MGGQIWVTSTVGWEALAFPSRLRSASPRSSARPSAPAPRLCCRPAHPHGRGFSGQLHHRLSLLEDTPYFVDVAETGLIACEMFGLRHYDPLLMDRQMPVMDGLTATRTIRAWEKADRAPTPIIALTVSLGWVICLAADGPSDQTYQTGCPAAGDHDWPRSRCTSATR